MSNFVEEKHDDFSYRYKITERLYSDKSEFQEIEVYNTTGFGKMLLNDGYVMVTDRDEFVYHDMIAHVPLFVHPNPKNVLVVGGGDGGTAREVLRHSSVESCVMVEIDPLVIEACREHIPQTSSVFNHEKLELLVQDGVKYVKTTDKKFDVVLVDSTEPFGPAAELFNKSFYDDVFRVLTDDGIVVSQGESCFYDLHRQKSLMGIISQVFPLTTIYNYHNLTYPGGLWSFTFASKGLNPIKDFDTTRVLNSGLEFQYYNPDMHKGSFALPTFQRNEIKEFIKGL